jgi:hypothetical protein
MCTGVSSSHTQILRRQPELLLQLPQHRAGQRYVLLLQVPANRGQPLPAGRVRDVEDLPVRGRRSSRPASGFAVRWAIRGGLHSGARAYSPARVPTSPHDITYGARVITNSDRMVSVLSGSGPSVDRACERSL